jgi:hypothetical protein
VSKAKAPILGVTLVNNNNSERSYEAQLRRTRVGGHNQRPTGAGTQGHVFVQEAGDTTSAGVFALAF